MAYPLQADAKDNWQYKAVDNLLGGIHSESRPDEMKDNECVTLLNVAVRQGKLRSDTGYIPVGQVVVGTPMGDFKFNRLDDSVDTMLVTTATLYKWSSSKKKWFLVKGTAGTTTTAGYAAGTTVIVVASGAGFSTGDLISVALNSGDQLQTTVTVAGTTFTLASPVPVGDSILNGAVVNRAVKLSGDTSHQISETTVASNDWWVFTNEIDIVKRYNGTDCVDVPNLPSAGNTICKAVIVYNAALFLLNTTEGGTAHPQRARRSDQADPTNWTTGTAGKDDLLDQADPIMCGALLGPYLIIYRERSIERGQFYGSGGINYTFDPMVKGDGAISKTAVVVRDDYHIVAGQFNVYRYKGGFNLEPIGDPIFQRVFSAQGDLNPSARQKVFCGLVQELDEVWFFYPSLDATFCDRLMRWNTQYGIWYERRFAAALTAMGLFQSTSVFSWDDLVGDWLDQTWHWDSQVTLSNSFAVHLHDSAVNQVYEYDYASTLDNGTAIQYTVETKDFLVPDLNLRFDMLEAAIQGDVTIFYSTDGGLNWTAFVPGASNAVLEKVRFWKQFLYQKVRFRFTGISPHFQLDWFAFSYKQESLF